VATYYRDGFSGKGIDEVDLFFELGRSTQSSMSSAPTSWGFGAEALPYCIEAVSPPFPPPPPEPPLPPPPPPSLPAPPLDCVQGIGDGYSSPRYEGGATETGTGKTCQHWAETSPHDHTYTTVSDWPGVGQPEENFCRNPGRACVGCTRYNGAEEGPWCFTTDPDVRWELCTQIPVCPFPPSSPPQAPSPPSMPPGGLRYPHEAVLVTDSTDAREICLSDAMMGGGWVNSGVPIPAMLVPEPSDPAPSAESKVWYAAAIDVNELKVIQFDVSYSADGGMVLANSMAAKWGGYGWEDTAIEDVDVLALWHGGTMGAAYINTSPTATWGYNLAEVTYTTVLVAQGTQCG